MLPHRASSQYDLFALWLFIDISSIYTAVSLISIAIYFCTHFIATSLVPIAISFVVIAMLVIRTATALIFILISLLFHSCLLLMHWFLLLCCWFVLQAHCFFSAMSFSIYWDFIIFIAMSLICIAVSCVLTVISLLFHWFLLLFHCFCCQFVSCLLLLYWCSLLFHCYCSYCFAGSLFSIAVSLLILPVHWVLMLIRRCWLLFRWSLFAFHRFVLPLFWTLWLCYRFCLLFHWFSFPCHLFYCYFINFHCFPSSMQVASLQALRQKRSRLPRTTFVKLSLRHPGPQLPPRLQWPMQGASLLDFHC